MKIFKIILTVVAVLGLIGVRVVESDLFYDPFQVYFKSANKNAIFPVFEWVPLIFNYVYRFLLNLSLSALIVHLLFLNKKWTFQAVILMVLVFALTFPIYLYCISTKFEIGYLFSFYMRRFVIQPLILLLIIPIFYYRKNSLTD